MKIIDFNTWIRKEHFEWFKNFDEPFWGIVSEVDCTIAYSKCKKEGIPFHYYYLYKSLMAVNLIDDIKLRIDEDKIICYDKIHAATTMINKDGIYAMSFVEFSDNLDVFLTAAKKEEARVKEIQGLGVSPDTMRKDVIHYSTVPWFKFTGLTHARNYKFTDSVPKITFGKYEEINNKKIMNLALNGHHGLVDGFHAGKYLSLFQELLNS